MRIAIIGASAVGVMAAKMLVKKKHDVVIVDRDRERIGDLSEDVDCGFVHGDGSRPHILREVGPSQTDYLFCLSDEDQDNIIASLVGRSLGFKSVVTKIAEPEFEHICVELGLDQTIVPDQTVARMLADMVDGQDVLELSTYIRGEVRFFAFVARKEDAGPVAELELPPSTKVMYLYREEQMVLAEEDTDLEPGDEVILVTEQKRIAALKERWGGAENEEAAS